VPGGDFIRLELPGGGGFGQAAERDPEQVALDAADGLISGESAARGYCVALRWPGRCCCHSKVTIDLGERRAARNPLRKTGPLRSA
jgi:N-methylhydantoinase B